MHNENSLLKSDKTASCIEAVITNSLQQKNISFTYSGSKQTQGSYTINTAPSKHIRACLLLEPRPDSFSFYAFPA